MTVQADFYLLDRPGLELEDVLRTLIKKAWNAGFCLSILAADQNQAEALDETLWQGDGFLAHELHPGKGSSEAPITITLTDKDLQPLVINLSNQPIKGFNELQRVLEIVPNESDLRQQCRQHYRSYQQLSWKLQMHKIN